MPPSQQGHSTMEFVDLKSQYAVLKSLIDERIRTVLEHGQFIMGPEVAELERRLAARTGSRYCFGCASGTDALLIALMAIGAGPGDEVVTTPFSFMATAETIAIVEENLSAPGTGIIVQSCG